MSNPKQIGQVFLCNGKSWKVQNIIKKPNGAKVAVLVCRTGKKEIVKEVPA